MYLRASIAQGKAPMNRAALSRIADARRRVSAATRELERLRKDQEEVSRVRDEAVVELHDEGETYQRIAEIAGLTRGRVAQILRRARRQ
jgi:DNA-directed RNA polymerase specialized sigma24 family protein